MIHMHFWIDKRSQGCVFNGRYLVPPSISGSRRAEIFCGGVYPKLMVTPVHYFGGGSGGCTSFGRRSRIPNYQHHARFLAARTAYQENVQNNNNNNNNNNSSSSNVGEQGTNAVNRSVTLLTSRENGTMTPRGIRAPAARLKCGVWAFFAMVTFFIAGAKFYFHGGTIGMEALAFCSFLILILVIGGLVSLYETVTSSRRTNQNAQISVQISSEQNETAGEPTSLNSTEVSPPPYHIAIMLPTQTENRDSPAILRDSPPPSYDKAVT